MGDLILGIDDAGRGPVVGPMVLAGCLINGVVEKEFRRIGVRDSKQLTKKRRAYFENLIKEKAETFSLEIVHPSEIDGRSKEGVNLNEVEARMASKIINKINKGNKKIKVVLDCPSPNRTKWRDSVRMKIDDLSNLKILCEHKADKNHVAVSAASILAKEEREREMATLRKKYGDAVGSGYPSDPKTKKFLESHGKKHKNKGIFRKSWKTWKKSNSDDCQKKLC
jgi:ribonuclease HII